MTADLQGRVALVTGANTGIGRVTARELARRGAHVIIACRSASRAQPVVDEIRALPGAGKVELAPLDLGDFASVRKCAADVLARGLPLHLLINNAGVAGARGITASGFELMFGVNQMGHFLLT
jgi:NAD(P)-dependent dehydrogenase (short-subunit alcohol dehydrogenase family)